MGKTIIKLGRERVIIYLIALNISSSSPVVLINKIKFFVMKEVSDSLYAHHEFFSLCF